jgi:hypothetical protein
MTIHRFGAGPLTTLLLSHGTRSVTSVRRNVPRGAMYPVILAVAAAAVMVAAGRGPTTVGTPQNPPSVASKAGAAPSMSEVFHPQGFISFIPRERLFTVMVPGGWKRVDEAGATTFTDQVDTFRIEQRPVAVPPIPETVRLHDLPALANANANSNANDLTAAVSVVDRRAGPAVVTTYLTAAAHSLVDPKASVDAVERYQFWRHGQEAILTVSGPAGFDNTALWRTITDSLRWL